MLDGLPGSGTWTSWVDERVAPLCEACVIATEVDGGGMAFLRADGTRDVVYATAGIATQLERVQADVSEGPAVEAARLRAPVLVADLLDPDGVASDRWPFFRSTAGGLGAAGIFAFPVQIGSVLVGTLGLYRRAVGPLAAWHVSEALRSADLLGAAVLELAGDETSTGLSTGRGTGLGTGLGTGRGTGRGTGLGTGLGPPRAFVHQAAGMVMVQLGCSIDEAMAQLQARAFVEGRPVATLSVEVVSGTRRFTKEQP